MRYLSELEIKQLGSIENLKLENLSPQLNIIFGENGKGKSTLRNAIRFGLFGLPRRVSTNQSEERFNTSFYSDINKVRDIRGILTGETDSYAFAQSNTDGKLSGPPLFSNEAGGALLEEMKVDIAEAEYRAVFTITSEEMDTVDQRGPDTHVSRFMASAFGADVNPSEVLFGIKEEIRAHDSTNKNVASSLKRALKEYTTEQKHLDALREHSSQIQNSVIEKRSIEERVLLLRHKQALLEEALRRNEECVRNFEQSKANLSKLKETTIAVSQKIEERKSELSRIPLVDAEKIVAQKELIETILEDESRIESHKTELSDLIAQIKQIHQQKERLGSLPEMNNKYDLQLLIEQSTQLGRELNDTQTRFDIAEQQTPLPTPETEQKPLTPGYVLLALAILGFIAGVALLFKQNFLLVGLSTLVASLCFLFGGLFFTRAHKPKQIAQPLPTSEKLQLEKALGAWETHLATFFPHQQKCNPQELQTLLAKLVENYRLQDELLAFENKKQHLGTQIKDFEAKRKTLLETLGNNSLLVQNSLKQALNLAGSLVVQALRIQDEIEREARYLQELTAQDSEESSRILTLKVSPEFIAEIETKRNERRQQAASLDQLNLRLGELNQIVESARNNKETESSRARLESLKTKVRESAKNLVVLRMADELLSESMKDYTSSETPDIMKQASEIFNRVTQSEYVSVTMDEHQGLRITDKRARNLEPFQLSRGTADQLYLSLRLGMLFAFKKRGTALPVIFDDVLSSFDEIRRAASLREIVKLSNERQVFFLTHDQQIFNEVQELAEGAHVYQL